MRVVGGMIALAVVACGAEPRSGFDGAPPEASARPAPVVDQGGSSDVDTTPYDPPPLHPIPSACGVGLALRCDGPLTGAVSVTNLGAEPMLAGTDIVIYDVTGTNDGVAWVATPTALLPGQTTQMQFVARTPNDRLMGTSHPYVAKVIINPAAAPPTASWCLPDNLVSEPSTADCPVTK